MTGGFGNYSNPPVIFLGKGKIPLFESCILEMKALT